MYGAAPAGKCSVDEGEDDDGSAVGVGAREDVACEPLVLVNDIGSGGGLVPLREETDPLGVPLMGGNGGGISARTEPERDRGRLLPEDGLWIGYAPGASPCREADCEPAPA